MYPLLPRLTGRISHEIYMIHNASEYYSVEAYPTDDDGSGFTCINFKKKKWNKNNYEAHMCGGTSNSPDFFPQA